MEISELMQRYGLNSRQTLYARLKILGMSLEKGDRNKVYANEEQVQLLDELDEHLKNGGTLRSFLPPTKTVPMSDTSAEILPGNEAGFGVEMSVMEMLVGAIATNIQPRSPLWYHQELERAAANEWLLTTKEIVELIGVKPVCKKGEDVFVRGCWRFTKCGKIGGSVAWLVDKV